MPISHLQQKKYSKIKYLDISNTSIADKDIKHLNLITLNASNNRYITNVNHFTNLRILDASRYCGIDDVGLSDLNLIELDASDNIKITDINHMTNLKRLRANVSKTIYTCLEFYRSECGISDKSIESLNLEELYVNNNPKVSNIGHMTKLKVLSASSWFSNISDVSIANLNLEKLIATDNGIITSVSHMSNLKELYAEHSNISDIKGINLRVLYIDNNENITDISHMTDLEVLSIKGHCGIKKKQTRNIKTVYTSNKKGIKQ